jgi:Domain of unknown function (DUF4760)
MGVESWGHPPMNRLNFSISRIWAIVGLFLLVQFFLLAIYHRSRDRDRQTVAFAASIVAGAFALYTYLQGLEQKQNECAEKLIERWNVPAVLPLRKPIREITEGLLDAGNFERSKRGDKLSEEQLGLRSDIVAILSFWEEVALAVRTKSANEEKIQRYFEPVMVQGYDCMRAWIENERKVDNEPIYFLELEKVVLRWKEMRTRGTLFNR